MYEASLILGGFVLATAGWVFYYSSVLNRLHQEYVAELKEMAEVKVRETVPPEVKHRTMWG